MHRAWSSIVEVPYCFSRSYVKFQGQTALKIVDFDLNWVFPDCNSSLNSPMAMKCCTELERAKERCSIVFQGHPSNFKVTRYKTSPIFTEIERFRTIGRSQLSNPSDLPCCWMYHSSVLYNSYNVILFECIFILGPFFHEDNWWEIWARIFNWMLLYYVDRANAPNLNLTRIWNFFCTQWAEWFKNQ